MTDFAFLGTETAAEWERWRFDNAVEDDGVVRLRPEPLPAYVDPTEVVAVPTDESPVVAVDVDDCGDLYLLRESGTLERYDEDCGRLRRFECTGVDLAGGVGRDLLVTPETVYVAQATLDGPGGVGSTATPSGRVVALSRHLRQTRWVVTDADAAPVALAERDGAPYVLFETADGGFLDRLAPDGSRERALTDLTGPRDATFDASGRCSVLDAVGGDPVVRQVAGDVLDAGAPASAPAPWDAPVPDGATCLAGGLADELLVGRRATGGAATLFRLSADGRDPLAGVDRGLAQLELDGTLYALAVDGRGVTALDARERFRRDETTGAYDARAVRSFDAGEPGTEWHRVTLGFRTPDPGTQVRLDYTATDDPVTARDVDWRVVTPANPHDVLLEGAVGRYLWLRIELAGSVSGTPEVETVRAYFPRQSYLRYLPALYRADPESRAFLTAFLSLFESTYVDLEEGLEGVTRYFDPEGVPPAYLGWLEEWLALETDETWRAAARRQLLADAPELFRGRGTVDGLLGLVDVYLDALADPSPVWTAHIEAQLDAVEGRGELSPADARTLRRRIQSNSFLLEYADLDCVEGAAREPYARLLECPQCFFVFVRPFVTDEQLRAVQSLVDAARPAHAVGRAVELEPSILLGGHSYLGINSVLPERDLVVGTGTLGRDSVLDEREGAGQLAVRARLGEDTTLS